MAQQTQDAQAENIRAMVSIRIPHMSTDELTQLYADLAELEKKYEATSQVSTSRIDNVSTAR